MPINTIIFSGTIVGSPRYNQGQSAICDFIVEQEEQGTKRDGTTFVSRNRQTVKAFGRAADAAARELRGGMSVIVQGRMTHTCKKQDNGDYAHYYSILADRWEVVGMAQQTQPEQQVSFGAPPQAQRNAVYAPPAPSYVQGTLPRPDLPPIQPLRAQPPQAGVDDTPF